MLHKKRKFFCELSLNNTIHVGLLIYLKGEFPEFPRTNHYMYLDYI